MRTVFIDTLCDIAAADERVWLVCGDLGYSVVERFAERFPRRFLNAGVAEQNMIGLAAGLAHGGKKVYVYSIVNFPVMRGLEQIRNDVCYHNLDVTVVAVGGGLVYGGQGYTHHGAEDMAVTRVLPRMCVAAPGDPAETEAATHALAERGGPAYLRLGKGGEPTVHAIPLAYKIGRAMTVRAGDAVAILTLGGTLDLAADAAGLLAADGTAARVVSMGTLAPFDAGAVLNAARETAGIVTVEEHGLGGLGTAAAEVLAEAGVATQFTPLRLRPEPITVAGSHAYLRERHGLTPAAVAAAARRMLR